MTAEKWFTFWQSQKLEQISRDVYEILILSRAEHQVTQEHVSILLTCVQELIQEIGNSIPLSQDFRKNTWGRHMENRYRTNLKKVFLSDSELSQLKHYIDQSGCQSFSEYARRTLLDPGMNFITMIQLVIKIWCLSWRGLATILTRLPEVSINLSWFQVKNCKTWKRESMTW